LAQAVPASSSHPRSAPWRPNTQTMLRKDVLQRQGLDPHANPSPAKAMGPSKLDERLCSTPMSQLSTAPPTPFQGWSLPDAQEDVVQGKVLFRRLMSAGSSTLGETADEARKLESPTSSLHEATSSDEIGEALDEADASTADSEEVCEEVIVDDPARITCVGMPPLKSGLGKWAQRVVAAEDWMEARLSTEFVVDNSNLKASTVGLAFRLSKNVGHRDRTLEGPHWGDSVTGLDTGDGWVQVGRRYLPRALSGQPVLLPASALGHHLARVDSEGLTKACSIDAHGVVHGAPAPWISRRFPGQADDRASRRKRFHEKLAQRRRQHATGWGDDITLCVDAGGKASIYLTNIVDRMERRRCKAVVAAMRAVREKGQPGYIFSTDQSGVVQEWLAQGESL